MCFLDKVGSQVVVIFICTLQWRQNSFQKWWNLFSLLTWLLCTSCVHKKSLSSLWWIFSFGVLGLYWKWSCGLFLFIPTSNYFNVPNDRVLRPKAWSVCSLSELVKIKPSHTGHEESFDIHFVNPTKKSSLHVINCMPYKKQLRRCRINLTPSHMCTSWIDDGEKLHIYWSSINSTNPCQKESSLAIGGWLVYALKSSLNFALIIQKFQMGEMLKKLLCMCSLQCISGNLCHESW